MPTRESTSPLVQQLQAVHETLRRDLRTCAALAEAALAGAPAAEIREGLRHLTVGSPLFRLKVSCLSYCELVHAHHGAEDVELFPAVRRAAPHLNAVVDRLEADHRAVSDLLDQVEELASGLDQDGSRQRLSDALAALSPRLLEHLDIEEDVLAPVLESWDGWPPTEGTGGHASLRRSP